ncbi:hypothetical protein FB45DRAFT_782479 [Roridomyces roridus]|uniref:Uncharacterized protein n=1 Tax=Roridomyces roridus TaxID=1738132 RepID=A0AAD7CFV2_9AGAR|nr:hypothetical protein FB45DRAFT_782479 [Roridomyces roridus]
MATIKTTTPTLPDYITYRYANRLVYVQPASTYETALDIAQKEFVELADVPRDRISFNTVATLNRQEPRVVRISESAWFAAVARQLCGGVIDIIVCPDPGCPPMYLAVPPDMGMVKEEIDILRKTRAASAPPTPSRSRQPSPSGRSTSSAKRSWYQRLV